MSDINPQWLAFAAAQSATEAAAELLRAGRENNVEAIDEFEPIEKLLDAVKMTIEAINNYSDERGQVYAAIVKYLEGWVP